jgi:hypothetical protein
MITAVLSIYIGGLYPESVYAGIAALLLGTVLGFISWLCVILVARHFVTIDRANSAVYNELRSRFTIARRLGEEANTKLDEKAKAPPTLCPSKHTATNEGLLYTRKEVTACIDRLKEVLGSEEFPQKNSNHLGVQVWVEGSGYITAWEELHRLEESLIVLAPLETVIADGYNDELRLEGSNIDNRDALLTRLRDNLAILKARLCGEQISKASQSESDKCDTVDVTPVMEILAREMLRHVRRAINQFRDERRRGLVQARNRLIKTVTRTGLVGLSVVAVAVLMCVQRTYISGSREI